MQRRVKTDFDKTTLVMRASQSGCVLTVTVHSQSH